MTVTPDTWERDQYNYWFERSCRYAALISAVDGYTTAVANGHLTADEALAGIGDLLTQLHADTRGDKP